MLSPEENAALDELIGLSGEISAAEQSPWEPRCVVRTFRPRAAGELVFTMQGWMALEAIRSPLLQGGLPETLDDLAAAAAIFALDVTGLDTAEAADVARALRRAVDAAFAMRLSMLETDAPANPENDGFGTWLPLYACLVTQCGLNRADALACPVGEAYALVAAMRRNQSWKVAGTPYALRDLEETKEDAANE